MPAPVRDPVPPLAHAVLEVFREALADVRFPDVDLATLETGASELLAAQVALEAAEAALDRARATVVAHASALTMRAQRALAYARVFAEDDAELRERLASVASARARTSASAGEVRDESAPPAKRRGRPKKSAEGGSLFAPTELPEEPAITDAA